MKDQKKIIAISGSTRRNSTNLDLINAIVKLSAEWLAISIFDQLAEIPPFNPDLDNDNPPKIVSDFRRKLKNADGILICTPEYARGVPGSLKNAIDWTVSSMEFSNKPVALITASSDGRMGHISLLETLKVIEADIPEGSQLLISFAKTKVKGNDIADLVTRSQVEKLIDSLAMTIQKREDPG